MNNQEFFTACCKASSVKELCEITGMKREAVNQRRTVMKKAGWVIPPFRKGPARSGEPTEADIQLMASLRGMTVEDIKKEMEKVKAAFQTTGTTQTTETTDSTTQTNEQQEPEQAAE